MIKSNNLANKTFCQIENRNEHFDNICLIFVLSSRIAKTFSYMIYIIHCNSCIYYTLSAWQAFGQIPYEYRGKRYLNKWVYNNEGIRQGCSENEF